MKSPLSLILASAAALFLLPGCQTGTAQIGAPGLPTISLQVDTPSQTVTQTSTTTPIAIPGQMTLSKEYDLIATADCPSGVQSVTISISGTSPFAVFSPGSKPTFNAGPNQATSGTQATAAASIPPLPTGSGTGQALSGSITVTATVTDYNHNTIATAPVTLTFTLPPSLALSFTQGSFTFQAPKSGTQSETLPLSVTTGNLTGTVTVTAGSNDTAAVSTPLTPAGLPQPIPVTAVPAVPTQEVGVPITIAANTSGATTTTITAQALGGAASATAACTVTVTPAIQTPPPAPAPVIASATNVGLTVESGTRNSYYDLILNGSGFNNTADLVIQPGDAAPGSTPGIGSFTQPVFNSNTSNGGRTGSTQINTLLTNLTASEIQSALESNSTTALFSVWVQNGGTGPNRLSNPVTFTIQEP